MRRRVAVSPPMLLDPLCRDTMIIVSPSTYLADQYLDRLSVLLAERINRLKAMPPRYHRPEDRRSCVRYLKWFAVDDPFYLGEPRSRGHTQFENRKSGRRIRVHDVY
jgi:hypothetical protein